MLWDVAERGVEGPGAEAVAEGVAVVWGPEGELEDCTEEERAEELKEARIEERMSSCSVEGPRAGSSRTRSNCGGGPRPSREGCRLGTWSSRSPEFELLDRESRGRDGKRGSRESCRWGDRGRGGGWSRSRALRGGGSVRSHSQGAPRSSASRDLKRPAAALAQSRGGCLRGRVLPRSLGSGRPGTAARRSWEPGRLRARSRGPGASSSRSRLSCRRRSRSSCSREE